MRQINICIPTWNRVEMTLKSFEKVYSDARIRNIIIVDDCSELKYYYDLKERCDKLEKVKLYRNITNRDCYANKYVATSLSTSDFCIILDSDKDRKSHTSELQSH